VQSLTVSLSESLIVRGAKHLPLALADQSPSASIPSVQHLQFLLCCVASHFASRPQAATPRCCAPQPVAGLSVTTLFCCKRN
jgi:hypothetical protein